MAGGVLVVRHAQSTWNAEGRFQGQSDPPLSDLGRAQAATAAARLAPRVAGTAVMLVASDLQRAATTATALGRALGESVHTDSALREIDGGAWQGLLIPTIEEEWPDEYRRWRNGEDIAWGGGERPSQAGARVAHTLRRWAAHASAAGRSLIAVGHGASLRAAMVDLLAWPDAYASLAPLDNTALISLSSLAGDAGPTRLVQWNVPLGE